MEAQIRGTRQATQRARQCPYRRSLQWHSCSTGWLGTSVPQSIAIAAMWSTSSRNHCIAGPMDGKHGRLLQFMATRWHEREGSFKVVKVDSHKDVQTDIAGFYGNELADHMAGLAAARHQLPPLTQQEVHAADKLQQEVAKHLVGCVEAMEEKFPAEKWSRIPSTRLEPYMAATTHQLEDTEGPTLMCTRCRQTRARGRARPWLEAGCPGGTPAECKAHQGLEHRSHSMRLTRGLRWCTECGAWSAKSKSVGLAGLCKAQGAGKGSRWALSRLKRGLPPQGLRTAWPDGTPLAAEPLP